MTNREKVLFAIGELHRLRSAKLLKDDVPNFNSTYDMIALQLGLQRDEGEQVFYMIEEGEASVLGYLMTVIEEMKFNSKATTKLVAEGLADKSAKLKPMPPAEAGSVKKRYAQVQRKQAGKDLYGVRVSCGACGAESMRLTSTDNRFIKCRECNQKLKLEQTCDEFLEADGQGIAFKANTPYLSDWEVKQMSKEFEGGAK